MIPLIISSPVTMALEKTLGCGYSGRKSGSGCSRFFLIGAYAPEVVVYMHHHL